MAERNGLVAATQVIKHLCRILAKFQPAMQAGIAAAVDHGIITPTDAATLNTYLDLTNAACAVIRHISGY